MSGIGWQVVSFSDLSRCRVASGLALTTEQYQVASRLVLRRESLDEILAR